MQEDIQFKENIQKIKNSTSTKKTFKKSNPNIRLSFLVLPKRFQLPLNYISASIEKDTFYYKDVYQDLWSKKSITAYDIMSFCSDKFSSEKTAYYYNKIIKELVDLNIIHEYRYCYSKKHNLTVRLFSIERKIYQWKYFDNFPPILPATAIRIIKSNREICPKTCHIINQINKKFTLKNAMVHFANYVYEKIIGKMSPDISKTIKPFSELKKDISVSEYLNSYLPNELKKFDNFYGLKDNTISNIVDKKPELINVLLDLHKASKFVKIKDYNVEKTLVAQEKDEFFSNKNALSYKRNSAVSSSHKNATNSLIISKLDKTTPSTTDIRGSSYINSYNNINNNNINKEYNDNMKKKSGSNLNGREAESCPAKKRGGKKMEKMCIKDISPENPSFKKTKRIHKIKIVGDERKYRNHQDGWICDGLTGKVLGSKKDFIKTFKKIIKKHHKEIIFTNYAGSYPKEMSCAGWVMDDLIKRDCNNEAIAVEWMEWYAQVYLKNKKINDPRFLSIEFFRKTWGAFDEVRRKDILIINPVKNSIINENSILFRIDKIFNNDYSDENILKALRFFGVVVVANYLRKQFGYGHNIESKIDAVFERIKKEPNKESILVSIFNSTCKFLCSFINDRDTVLLKNWVEKYNIFWSFAKCNFDYYKKNNILIESEKNIAEDFFKEIYDIMGTK